MPSSARSCKRLQECSRRPRKRKAHLTERSVNEVRISTLWQRGASDDQIDGEARDDETQGLAGDDRFDGGPGDDRIDGSGRLDVCTGGTGNDTSLTAISYAVSRSRNGHCTLSADRGVVEPHSQRAGGTRRRRRDQNGPSH